MLSGLLKVAAGSALAIALLLQVSYRVHAADTDEAFIVECTRPCDAIRSAVGAAGGVVTHQFENVDAIAVRVPRNAVSSLVSVAGATSVHKDVDVDSPVPVRAAEVSGQAAEPLEAAAFGDIQPDNYNFNLGITNVAPLHAIGERGQDVVVALIDSGTANVATLVELGSSVIGGETFVPATQDPLSATHRENGFHGTMTADMIAAHGVFLFLTASPFVQAINRYAPRQRVPVLDDSRHVRADAARCRDGGRGADDRHCAGRQDLCDENLRRARRRRAVVARHCRDGSRHYTA